MKISKANILKYVAMGIIGLCLCRKGRVMMTVGNR